jgi:biopolymer transport protein ExbD
MHTGSHSSSPVQIKRARIEIIPLIDIMFFLLASFMLVSLSMINMKGFDVSLPTAKNTVQQTDKPDFTLITIDTLGDVYVDKQKTPDSDLLGKLKALYEKDHNSRVFVHCEKEATYERLIFVWDRIRLANLQKVGLDIKDKSPGAP